MTAHDRTLIRGSRATFARATGEGDGRTIGFTFATSDVARDGHRIMPGAWESKGHDGLADFRSNPVFCFAHRTDEPPVGRVVNVGERNGQLLGAVRFPTSDEYAFGDTVFQLFRGGFMNAASVSWTPLDWTYSKDKNRAPGAIDFNRVELLEISAVPVPADPGAIATARSRGIDTGPLAAWAARRLDEQDFRNMSRHDLEFLERAGRADAARAKVYPGAATGTDGFRSLGEFLRAVALDPAAGGFTCERDARLRSFERGPSGNSEVEPTGGGFAVPTTFLDEIVGSIYAESALGNLIDKRETEQPIADVKLPAISETTRADGGRLGGVVSYWVGEGVTPPSSFPKWRSTEFSAKKLIVVTTATAELVADAPLFESTFREAIASEFGCRLDQAVIAGKGTTPLGVVDAPPTITVSKTSGQTAGTIVAENISAMWARLPGPLRRRAVWVGNGDVEAQLDAGAFSGLYMPAGADGDTSPRIKGRPLIISEASPQLGTPGDLILMDPRSYLLISNPVRFAVSIHAKWLTNEVVFRVVWRVDGKPKYSTPITPANGGQTVSPFVMLGSR